MNDITLRYMFSNVGETFHALETNNGLLETIIPTLIFFDILSIFSKTISQTSFTFSNKAYILDLIILGGVTGYAFINMNNNLDERTLVNQGVEMVFPTAYAIHTEYKPVELVYPAILGSKSAAIKLLGTIEPSELNKDAELALNLAKILIMNIEASGDKGASNYPLPVIEIPDAYSEGDKRALTHFINGDLINFEIDTHRIINDIERTDHSYAANLLKLIHEAKTQNSASKEIIETSRVTEMFLFITGSRHKG
ncbi:hypothetical protein OTK49_01590 [Vibrio coralliirubri]|uniref:hypothetical protein n=1 Tax=Vibrio coralliirubri TaxID=1516159 RepID=UPI002284F19F|nr:hypothetical protein [Vibrio coralliirubri]MCY9861218.1 hypothetical protein [Vibrio coralliirubri]